MSVMQYQHLGYRIRRFYRAATSGILSRRPSLTTTKPRCFRPYPIQPQNGRAEGRFYARMRRHDEVSNLCAGYSPAGPRPALNQTAPASVQGWLQASIFAGRNTPETPGFCSEAQPRVVWSRYICGCPVVAGVAHPTCRLE